MYTRDSELLFPWWLVELPAAFLCNPHRYFPNHHEPQSTGSSIQQVIKSKIVYVQITEYVNHTG